MVLYNIYSKSPKCIYKTSICSKATIIIFIINLVTFLVPFLIAFKTQGLWMKHDQFIEQPDVHFKYDYLIILETEKIEKPIICTTFSRLEEISEDLNDCQYIKVREDDFNKDDLIDRIHFEAEAAVEPRFNVLSVTVILKFNYKIYSHSLLEMEGIGHLREASSPQPGGSSGRLEAVADLRLVQRTLLPHRGRYLLYNTTSQLNEDLDIFDFLVKYSERNFTTRFENVYTSWSRGRTFDQPFTLSLTINIPSERILYKPGFWQMIKMAWLQYLALLYLSILISRRIKHFILDNRLVHNVKVQPWKKYL